MSAAARPPEGGAFSLGEMSAQRTEGRPVFAAARPPEGGATSLLNTLSIPIRWSDMDVMGHVNNAVYFRYMEQARIDWFDQVGIRTDPTGNGPVVIHVACTFRIPFVYPGTVLARHYLTGSGRSSIDTRVEMARADAPERLCAEGTARIVWVDFSQGRSMPLPDTIRTALARVRQAAG